MFHPRGPTFWELAHQALSSTKKGYDLLADKFEYTPFRTPDAILTAVADHLGPSGEVLDLCCGTGAALRCFRSYADRSVGVDFSPGMLAEARRLSDGQGTEWIEGDVLDLAFRETFDTALCFGALGHIRARDEDRFLRGVFAALKPGGRFAFVTGARPPLRSWQFWLAHGFNAAMFLRNLLLPKRFIMYYLTFLWPEVESRLQQHGFQVACHAGLFPSPYAGCLLVVATKPRDNP